MAMLFSGQIKKESPSMDLLFKQAEAGTHSDTLLIENGRQLVASIPDRVSAPSTKSSKAFDHKLRHFFLRILDRGHPFLKPK